MTPVFPEIGSGEFRAAMDALRQELLELGGLFDRRSVRGRAGIGAAASEAMPAAVFEEVLAALNGLLARYRTLRSYIQAFVTTDAADEAAQAALSELAMLSVALDQLRTRWTAWTGCLDLDALLAASGEARAHEFQLRRLARLAACQMPEGEESLAAELAPSGLGGWARLHSDVSSLLTVRVVVRGEERVLPMSAVRGLANDPDRETRRSAYSAELAAWEGVAVPLAAALNGIKGYQGVVRRRRGYADDVAPTLIQNSIDAATLQAMQAACVESFPDFRRYLQAKARLLGEERLAWFDVNAPVGRAGRTFSWNEAEELIRRRFGQFSPRMRGLADRAFRERWIDAEPRPGKEGGAYCSDLRGGESRILMNFDGSLNSVSTLAHELGHAYHNLALEPRTPIQRSTPSTLAETASIFCETIVYDAMLGQLSGPERLGVLDVQLQRDLLVVVDIHSRFLFESAVFARRAERELTPGELCALMLEVQRATYGDGLEGSSLHPYMWAVKGHYYGPTFYNYPYTFGLLFGLGLYARYRSRPDGFREGYDELLASTGLADAPSLAARFGIDVRSPDFWRSSLDVIREAVDEFEELAARA